MRVEERITKITAHRGYWKDCKENTIQAFDSALKHGADRIEFDVHFTKDRELVVHHDYFTVNIEGRNELISSIKREELNKDIPTLQQVLEFIGNSVELEVELKGSTIPFVEAVLKMVQQNKLFPKVEITSSHLFVLGYIRNLFPETKLGMFIQRFPEWMTPQLGHKLIFDALEVGRIDVAHCPFSILNTDLVENLRNKNKLVHAADCNEIEELRTVFELRVDQVSTNELELAQSVRKEVQGI